MKRNTIRLGIMIGLLVAGLAGTADAGGMVRQARHTQRATPAAKAIAALSPIGAATGWGRVKIEEQTQIDGTLKREVTAELFSLDPSAEYTVTVDDVMLGQVFTDAQGWAVLKLESPSTEFPPVPDELPRVADLVSAAVTDASDAFVLEGSFVQVGDPWEGDPDYEERIVLEDVTGIGVAGIAKVESNGASKQVFETRASGLIPGDQYRIVVDGFEAGLVTADAVGQARLRLEYLDDENPLPEELTPVEDIRQVEWLDGNDEILLSGTFTGVPNNDGWGEKDSFGGLITEFTADGFTLQTGMGAVQVVVTSETVFENFSSLDELAIGDMVQVEGSIDGTTVIAETIELKIHNDEEITFAGQITEFTADGFILQTGMGTVQVVVTSETVFENFSSLDELAIGDMVQVEGSIDGTTVIAATIELKTHSDEEITFAGQITEFTADGFILQTGMGTVQVVVTSETVFENFSSLDELAIGDIVQVEGSVDGTTVIAATIELKIHNDDGDMESFGGLITALAADGFTLQTGMGTVQVVVTSETVFENFSSLDELAIGDTVHVEGSIDGTTVIAATIELVDHNDGGDDDGGGGGMDSEEYSGRIVALTADGFTLQIGMSTVQVVVTPETVFENFSSLDELRVYDRVEVHGVLQGNSILAESIRRDR